MPPYVIEGSHTDEGTKGLLQDGGSPLLSIEDVDRAAKTTVAYRAPGA